MSFMLALLVAAAAPAALSPDPDTDAAVTAEANAEDKMICKEQAQTNSRFRKKTCRKKSEWAAIAEENKRSYAEQRDRPVIEIRRDQ